jgi:hypothetical protein
MIFGQLPHAGQFAFQVEVHSLSQPMTRRFRGSAPILPQSSFRYPQAILGSNWAGLDSADFLLLAYRPRLCCDLATANKRADIQQLPAHNLWCTV